MTIQADPQRLRRSVAMIIGERSVFSGQRQLDAAEKFIAAEFASYGLLVESDHFAYGQNKFRNIIAHGQSAENGALIIIGAHYDSVPGSPGADDNASGVAVLLEAARLLAQIRPPVSRVRFCAFNLEELGMIGSAAFARQLKSAQIGVEAMISLEMVGYTDPRPGCQKYPAGLGWIYPDHGDFIGVVGNWNSRPLLRKFSAEMRKVPNLPVETLSVPGNGGLVPAVRLSDHAPFWDLGYPALMVTDTSFYRNPHYHKATDTGDTLDIEFMAKVCDAVVRGVLGRICQ